MKRSFILTYSKSLGTADEVKAWATNSPFITTWRYEMWECFFLVSEHSADHICSDIRHHFGETKGRYIVTEYSDDKSRCQGLLTPGSWYFLRNQTPPAQG